MPNAPSNHDLHIMLVKVDGKLDALLAKNADFKEWQENHEKKDVERFTGLSERLDGFSDRLDSLRSYAASVALVGSGIGFGLKYIWDNIRGAS